MYIFVHKFRITMKVRIYESLDRAEHTTQKFYCTFTRFEDFFKKNKKSENPPGINVRASCY